VTDDEFLAAFADCSMPLSSFTHVSHLRLAWLQLQRSGFDGALAAVRSDVVRFATFNGKTGVYHETLTRLWLALVAHAIETAPAETFDAFLETNAWLLDRGNPAKHYRAETLASDAARSAWVEPDLAPLPVLG
jgi:hypothetical protein